MSQIGTHKNIPFLLCHFQSLFIGTLLHREGYISVSSTERVLLIVLTQQAVCALTAMALEGFRIALHYFLFI